MATKTHEAYRGAEGLMPELLATKERTERIESDTAWGLEFCPLNIRKTRKSGDCLIVDFRRQSSWTRHGALARGSG
jgi:hypothetical protein